MTDSRGGDTPAVARQRVRRWLRQARQETDFTQTDIAKRLGWSLSKVQRIEAGEVAISESDLRAVFALFGVTDAGIIDALVKDARLARRERWTTNPEHRKYLPTGLLRLLQFESAATQIRSYQHLVLPGVLQTRATARYFFDPDDDAILSADERRVRYEVRLRRRQDVIERPDGPLYFLVIDESVILRNVGSLRDTAEQLEDLAESASRPRVSVRVVPLDEGRAVKIGLLGSFSLTSLSHDADDDALYRERFLGDYLDHDPEEIRPYRDAFEGLWKLALPEDASLRLIQAKAAELRARLDRLPASAE
jgi:transcriptional regulator with XRE-family HTH domain